MTEVTRNSAMVREPTTIHTTTATSTADESSSSTTHLASPTSESQQEISIMPDLSETKLHDSRNPNNRTPAGELRHKHAGHHSSGDEGTHDEEDKHDGNDEVSKNIMLILYLDLFLMPKLQIRMIYYNVHQK